MFRAIVFLMFVCSLSFAGEYRNDQTVFKNGENILTLGFFDVLKFKGGDFTGSDDLPTKKGVLVVLEHGFDPNGRLNSGTPIPTFLQKINGKPVASRDEVLEVIKAIKPGKITMDVILGEYSEKKKKYYTKSYAFSFTFTELVFPAPDPKPSEPVK